MKKRLILYAEEGRVITDGKIYGKVVYLAEGKDSSDYYEITDEEYEEIKQETSAEEEA